MSVCTLNKYWINIYYSQVDWIIRLESINIVKPCINLWLSLECQFNAVVGLVPLICINNLIRILWTHAPIDKYRPIVFLHRTHKYCIMTLRALGRIWSGSATSFKMSKVLFLKLFATFLPNNWEREREKLRQWIMPFDISASIFDWFGSKKCKESISDTTRIVGKKSKHKKAKWKLSD